MSMIDFPDSFFEEEVRCDFTITSMMKRAWAAEMEVFAAIDKVCKENDINYSAGYGTLLGAVRHKGFIPWDDDMDIIMLREDYDKFVKVAPTALPKGFVVAGMYASSERLQEACFAAHTRIIADENQWDFNDYMKYFHGFPYQRIGVDIFPMDTISSNDNLWNLQKSCYLAGMTLLTHWDEAVATKQLEEHIVFLEKLSGVTIPRTGNVKNFIWRLLDATISLARKEEKSRCTYMVTYSQWGSYSFEKDWIHNTTEVPFENITVPIPVEYDKVLSQVYRDYMTLKKGGGAHDYPFYGDMEEELAKQVKAVGFPGSVDEFCMAMSKGEFRCLPGNSGLHR